MDKFISYFQILIYFFIFFCIHLIFFLKRKLETFCQNSESAEIFHFGGKTIKEVQNEILNHKQKHVIETQPQPRCTHKFNQAHMGKHKKILHGS